MSDRDRLRRAIDDVRRRAENMSPKPVPRADASERREEVTVRVGPASRGFTAAAFLAAAAAIGAAYAGARRFAAAPATAVDTRVDAARPVRLRQIPEKAAPAAEPSDRVEGPEPADEASTEPSTRGAQDEPARARRSSHPKPAPSWWW